MYLLYVGFYKRQIKSRSSPASNAANVIFWQVAIRAFKRQMAIDDDDSDGAETPEDTFRPFTATDSGGHPINMQL